MSVFSTQEPDSETDNQTIASRDTFHELSESLKYKLASNGISQKIQAIGQKYRFELLRLANITRLIREYYFGEVRFENFPTEIEKRMSVSLLTAQEITRYIKSEIIDWDPWAEYIAKLPKLPIREIAQKFPKIADTEITAGYIELKGSDELSDPSIKNWIKDYVSHLGYDRHSQMDRTQYLFHSENGKSLSSQDREKLGIILKSFDENFPLPVDEENGEIVFDGMIEKNPPPAPPFSKGERPIQNFPLSQRGIKGDFENAPTKQESFIKPYSPISRPTLPLRQTSSSIQATPPQPRPASPQPSPLHIGGQAYKGERDRPVPQFRPAANIPDNFASQTGKEEINKYFNTHESPDIPAIKIHSITEHNEPKMAQQVPPKMNIQRPVPTLPPRQASSPQSETRPKYKIIDPFFSKPEPRIDGNIVDLSDK